MTPGVITASIATSVVASLLAWLLTHRLPRELAAEDAPIGHGLIALGLALSVIAGIAAFIPTAPTVEVVMGLVRSASPEDAERRLSVALAVLYFAPFSATIASSDGSRRARLWALAAVGVCAPCLGVVVYCLRALPDAF